MILIAEATVNDLPIIRDIAYRTWPNTYGDILSMEQVSYMLDLFYNEELLLKNYSEKVHQFLLAREGTESLGFASFEHNYKELNLTRIHKLYVLPESHGKGAGKVMMDALEVTAKANHSDSILLNVNRFNKAVSFYTKVGFEIVGQEDIVLEHGYLMEDYIMRKRL